MDAKESKPVEKPEENGMRMAMVELITQSVNAMFRIFTEERAQRLRRVIVSYVGWVAAQWEHFFGRYKFVVLALDRAESVITAQTRQFVRFWRKATVVHPRQEALVHLRKAVVHFWKWNQFNSFTRFSCNDTDFNLWTLVQWNDKLMQPAD